VPSKTSYGYLLSVVPYDKIRCVILSGVKVKPLLVSLNDWANRVKIVPKIVVTVTDLLRVHAREAKHANLVRDVGPVAVGTFLLEQIAQLTPYSNDSVSHKLYVLQPTHKISLGLRVMQ